MNVLLCYVLEKWNESVDEIDKRLWGELMKKIGETCGNRESGVFLNAVIEFLGKAQDDVYDGIRDLLVRLYNISQFVLYVSGMINDVNIRMRLRRLGKWMEWNVLSLVHSVEIGGIGR